MFEKSCDKEHEIRIKRYLTENENLKICNQIMYEVLKNRGNALISLPLKGGKTTFSLTYIPQYLEKAANGAITIYVSPRVSLLLELNSKYDIMQVSKGVKEKDILISPSIPIAVTNDSLHKAINKCKRFNKKYFLVIDESHEMVTSYVYRRNITSPFKFYNNDVKGCLGAIFLTGTPEPLELVDFKSRYTFCVENKFFQTDMTEIRCNFDYKNSILAKTKTIELEKEKSKNPIIIRNNNKEENKKIKEMLLRKDTNLKIYLWHRETTMQEEEEFKQDKEILLSLFKQEKCEYDVIITTSLIDVGIELYLDYKPVVLDFLGKNANIIDDIQFIGRFRNGTSKFIILGKMDTFKEEEKTHRELYEETLKNAKSLQKILNKHQEYQQVNTNLLQVNIKEDRIEYTIDEMLIKAEAFRLYAKQFLTTPTKLMNFLKAHSTYNSREYKIVPSFRIIALEACDETTINIEDKEQRKEELNLLTQKREAIIKIVENLENKYIEDLLLEPKDLKYSKQKEYILNLCEKEYLDLHSKDFKEYVKQYYLLKRYDRFDNSCTNKEILLIVLNNKYNKIINYNRKIALAIWEYNSDEKIMLQDILFKRVDCILDSFYNLDTLKAKKEDNKRLFPITFSKKIQEELLEKIQDNSILKKQEPKDILKLINEIFEIKEYERITSFNCDEKFEKSYRKIINNYLENKPPTKSEKCKKIYYILDILDIKDKKFPINLTDKIKKDLSNAKLDKLINKIFNTTKTNMILNIKQKKLNLKSLL